MKQIAASWLKPRVGVELPPKKWFGSLSEEVIRERQRALEAYLNHLLRIVDPLEYAALATFLDLYANLVRYLFGRNTHYGIGLGGPIAAAW